VSKAETIRYMMMITPVVLIFLAFIVYMGVQGAKNLKRFNEDHVSNVNKFLAKHTKHKLTIVK